MRTNEAERLFDELYAEHRSALHAFFLGRTSDRELALDLLQEAFVRLWRSIQVVAALAPNKRQHWLYAVARNLVIDTYRSRGAGRAALDRLERLTPPSVAEPPETDVLQHEQHAAIDAAIAQLPDDLRTVLVLQLLGERTSAEIGAIVGRPAGTVRYQLAQARRLLAGALAEVVA